MAVQEDACECRYLAGLFALAHDPSTEVRKPVCTGLVQLLHLQPERLGPHMQSIIEYMLDSTQVRSALEAQSLCAEWLCQLSMMPPCTCPRGLVRPKSECNLLARSVCMGKED